MAKCSIAQTTPYDSPAQESFDAKDVSEIPTGLTPTGTTGGAS